MFIYNCSQILVDELTGETAKLPFKAFIVEMKNKYKTLLKVHVKGKRSVQFEQAWLCHIEEYFTEPSSSQSDGNSNMETSLHSQWAALVNSIHSKPTIQDQRIVVSTLSYFIYDLKAEKVKDYKESFASAVSVNDGPNLPDVEYIFLRLN